MINKKFLNDFIFKENISTTHFKEQNDFEYKQKIIELNNENKLFKKFLKHSKENAFLINDFDFNNFSMDLKKWNKNLAPLFLKINLNNKHNSIINFETKIKEIASIIIFLKEINYDQLILLINFDDKFLHQQKCIKIFSKLFNEYLLNIFDNKTKTISSISHF